MRFIISFLFLIFFSTSFSQRSDFTNRINKRLSEMFEDSVSSWSSLIAKAQEKNKYIFIHWVNVSGGSVGSDYNEFFFPKEVSTFLDSNFILISIKNSQYSASEYIYTKLNQDFIDSLKRMCNLDHWQAKIILDKNGKPLYKNSYSYLDSNSFLQSLQRVLKGEESYYPLLNEYKQGNRKPEFIRKLCYAARGANENFVTILKSFIESYPNQKLFTKENGEVIYEFAKSDLFWSYEICFNNLFQNRTQWYKVLGKEKVDRRIIEMQCEEFSYLIGFPFRKTQPNILLEKGKEEYFKKFTAFKEYDSIVINRSACRYLYQEKAWTDFLLSLNSYIKNYNGFAEEEDIINDYTWGVFKHSNDKHLLKRTLKWCKDKLSKSKNHYYIDTYANLQYKLGKKRIAMKYETKAVILSTGKEKSGYETTLQKMKSNEPTW